MAETELEVWECFECRICWTVHDNEESAQFCCNPVRHSFVCSDCEEDFEFLQLAVRHVHGKALQRGESPLAEWAVQMEVEQSLDA